jgi:hypothetical protein
MARVQLQSELFIIILFIINNQDFYLLKNHPEVHAF